jgi:hypothetical protein
MKATLFFFVLWALSAQARPVEHYETSEEILQGSCRIATLTSDQDPSCGSWSLKPFDFLYVPKNLGDQIARDITEAYVRGYYFHMDKKDFFHGHLVSMGPKTVYDSPEDFYADVTLILFHSREYLPHAWDEAAGSRQVPRSFIGYLNGHGPEGISPAIDSIAPGVRLMNSYKTAGTIYTENITDSLPALTQHSYHPEDPLFIGECGINSQLYLLADPQGRWITPDGVRIDMFLQCKYKK